MNKQTNTYGCFLKEGYTQIIHFRSMLVEFSIINHPFWGAPIYGNPHIPLSLRFLLLTPHTSYILITLWFYLHLSNLLIYALGPSIYGTPHIFTITNNH